MINANILNGVKIFGQLLSHPEEIICLKICKILVPDLLELIEFNVLCHNFDVFDPCLSIKDFMDRSEIYIRTLWALSNLATCQSYSRFEDACIIPRELYKQIIQIAWTARDSLSDMQNENPDSMKKTAIRMTKYGLLFVESMYVLCQCLLSSQEENVFNEYINDVAVTELIMSCLE